MRAWAQCAKTRLERLSRGGWVLFATIPFALLANSSQVAMTLTIERDGGALRQIVTTAAPYFRSQLPKWVNDVQAGRRWDRAWQNTNETTSTFARDYRSSSAAYGEQGQLTITDVFQNPLSIYTTYTWKEEINIAYMYETDASAAAAAGTALKYTVRMPGRVIDAQVQPGKGSTAQPEGNAAVFSLAASEAKATITATSSRVRWGYLLVVIYALTWITLEVLQIVGRQVRRRPRKI